jgi:urease alpha subunit
MYLYSTITRGIRVSSTEVGKVADLVAFQPALFGSKPEFMLKVGNIGWGQMGISRHVLHQQIYKLKTNDLWLGDANGSISTTEHIVSRPMFGSFSSSLSKNCAILVSQALLEKADGVECVCDPVDTLLLSHFIYLFLITPLYYLFTD